MTNGDQLPELREGDEYPGANWFNAARRLIYRALRLNVADGSGLEISQGMDGAVLSGQVAGGGGGGGLYRFVSPSGGIAHGTSTSYNGRTIHNIYAHSNMPGGAIGWYTKNGDAGQYEIVGWEC